jgi:hypothetical protein
MSVLQDRQAAGYLTIVERMFDEITKASKSSALGVIAMLWFGLQLGVRFFAGKQLIGLQTDDYGTQVHRYLL